MEQLEYMRMKLSNLPQEFDSLYDLTKIAEDNGNVYIKVQKGMYSLPQAGISAHRLLEQRLNEHGYQQSQVTPGLWKHALRPISFTLCINNFGVKYVGREHAKHLLQVLNMHYKLLDVSYLLALQRSYLPRNCVAIPTQVHSLYFSRYTSYHFIRERQNLPPLVTTSLGTLHT